MQGYSLLRRLTVVSQQAYVLQLRRCVCVCLRVFACVYVCVCVCVWQSFRNRHKLIYTHLNTHVCFLCVFACVYVHTVAVQELETALFEPASIVSMMAGSKKILLLIQKKNPFGVTSGAQPSGSSQKRPILP